MKTFLKPLSKEEESACLEALRGSDGVKAREAKQVLIERNLRLVAISQKSIRTWMKIWRT